MEQGSGLVKCELQSAKIIAPQEEIAYETMHIVRE